MRKTKLELCEEILSALVDRNLSINNIAFLCNIDYTTATNLLDFLEKNQLVENNHSYIKVLYSLTTKGEEVYKTLTKAKRINKMRESIVIKETKCSLPPISE